MSSEYPVDGDPEEMPLNDNPEAAIEALQKLVAELQAEKAELQDKHLRAVAESQNIRRRGQQDVEKERKFGIERFARDLLSVADNLGRALTAVPAETDPAMKNVVVGVEATERELLSVLERHGVSRIKSIGEPFNADFHQAMMEIEDPSVPAGTVVQEMIPGYLLAGRLLRAAMVAVSKGGPSRSFEASNENGTVA
ncbi:MAG TPA: nucleotide exchange factor GrpE [Reyranella sp.]|jgi:molecular chaperone GrpE